ncbi:amidohydrolase [Thalassoglobus sp. JC818]|uniref:amidohydrolase n=1 Tax=Thalassoglobus sp. JC818 TaxID=3232136 RepID=UPI0034576D0D
MAEISDSSDELTKLVNRCQQAMAHAWVVRAFLRHSDEAEDFPELTYISRSIFDVSRALETRVNDPIGYFKMLRKKVGKFRAAVEEFAKQVPDISSHTNFAQSVISLRGSVTMLEESLNQAREVAIQAEASKTGPAN